MSACRKCWWLNRDGKTLATDRIQADILKALATELEWRRMSDGRRTLAWSLYPIIIGAASNLLQCKRLIGGWTGPNKRWQDETLYRDFCEAVSRESSVEWAQNSNFRLHSIGAFLESAQHDTAAALDKTINAWLALECGLPVERVDDPWYSTWIASRLTILDSLLRQKRRRSHTVRALMRVYVADPEVADHRMALRWAQRQTHLFVKLRQRPRSLNSPLYERLVAPGGTIEQRLQEIYALVKGGTTKTSAWSQQQIAAVQASTYKCAAFVFSRHNVFKHVILANPRRMGLPQHLVECVLTARAIECVASLWKALVKAESLAYAERKKRRV